MECVKGQVVDEDGHGVVPLGLLETNEKEDTP